MAALAPEILINTLLQNGFAAVKADTSIVQEVFSNLIEEEQAEINAMLGGDQLNPKP